MDDLTVERFEANRHRLASLAYRLLGSAADAEDTVQDAYLRWHAADRTRIEVPEARLTTVVTNLALDRLRSARARRERAAGDWLPEPLLDGDPMLGPAETAEQRESVTLAVLTLLERLQPVERAVYVLREAFGYGHAEIAGILRISEAASQQHAHRAKRRVAAVRAGAEIDRAAARRVVEAFTAAARSGRPEQLVAMLTADATAISDGAGQTRRWLRFSAPEKIAGSIQAFFRPTAVKRKLVGGSPEMHAALVNGGPALVASVAGQVIGVVVLDVRGDRIEVLRGISDPVRLARVAAAWRRHDPGAPLAVVW